jgi:hypothetical protein
MNDTGQDVRATLLAGSDDMPPGIDLLRGVRHHAADRPRQRRRRALVSAGAAAAAGGVAASATLLATSVTNPPSALAAVTSAVTKTSAQSYRFSLSSTLSSPGGGPHSRGVFTGAIDPRHNLGSELLVIREPAEEEQMVPQSSGPRPPVVHKPPSTITAQIRFVGKYVYTWVSPGFGLGTLGKPWNKAPIPPPGTDVFPGAELHGAAVERPVSPTELLGVLRSAATVRKVGPASGPGWIGTKYAFTTRPRPGRAETVSGTVYVDQQGRVRGLATVTTFSSPAARSAAARSAAARITITDDLTFGDFGGPVSATAPPASQVKYTSTPYWVFGF